MKQFWLPAARPSRLVIQHAELPSFFLRRLDTWYYGWLASISSIQLEGFMIQLNKFLQFTSNLML
jgi:hypothetical protein